MTDVNVIRIEGRLSAPPETRELPSGDQLVALRVVVRRPDGDRVDSLPVVVGPPPRRGQRRRPGQADTATVRRAQRLSEDDRVAVDGWLQRRFWRSGDGAHTRLEVVASAVEPLAAVD